jgi:hypothetical protein
MSNDHHARSCWGVTNGTRVDPHSFTCAYVSAEKDMVSYGPGMWVYCNTPGVTVAATVAPQCLLQQKPSSNGFQIQI